MVHDGVIEYNSILAFSLKSDGSPLILCRTAPTTKRVKNRPILVPGDIQAYNITDALSSSGTLTVNQGTNPWTVAGAYSNNNADPGGTKVAVLPAKANASAPGPWTEGAIAPLSVDLNGNLRAVTQTPIFQTMLGNATLNNTYGAVLLSAIIGAVAGGNPRSLTISTFAVSSKTVPASTTNDLLDRPVAWPNGTNLAIFNGVAGETAVLTWVRVT